MLFLANFDPPSLLSHFVTHPGTPQSTSHISDPPIFSRPSTKHPDKKPCTNSLSIVREGFCPGAFVKGSFAWKVLSGGGFCPFPLVSEYICYNRKLKITLNFMFQMYDKKIYKCDVTCSLPPTPTPCHKLSHLLGPPNPSSVTYFMDGP